MKTEEEIRKRFNYLDSEIDKAFQHNEGRITSVAEYNIIERLSCERDTLEWVLADMSAAGGT